MTNWLKRFADAYRATKYTGGNPASSQYWVKKLFGVSDTTLSGVTVDTDTALKYSAVWSAVNIISGAVGFLPMMIYKRIDARSKEPIINHPAYNLLHSRPNPYMDALTFKETLQAHVLIWGNGYAEIERDGAMRPKALWPLLPNRVVPKVVDGTLVYDVANIDNQGRAARLPFDNVLHIKGLGFDGLKGYPVIEYMAENLGLGIAAERNASAFFGNDSSPTGILHTDDVLNKETKEKLEKDWEEKHKGLDERYRVAILHSGLKWQQIGVDAKQSQLIESRKFSISDIARWFTIPPHMIAQLDRATFSNIEHQGIEFVTWTLLKWLRRWELECGYKLFRSDEQSNIFPEFLVDALLRGDTKARYDAYNVGRQAGFLSVNDIRGKENMNPVDGGDVYLEPLNMKSVGQDNETDSFRDLFKSTWQRIITKEVKAIRKALKKPEDFIDWLDDFYAKHTEHVSSVIKPVLEACNKDSQGIETLANDYVGRQLSTIKTAFEEKNVDSILTVWEAELPQELTEKVLNGEYDNAIS